MALLGKAALAMWWDMAPGVRQDFEHWHTHEHFPERLGIPGFLRASRWTGAAGGEGIFVMYELQDHAVLSSPDYLARLNAPTPWSTRLMPHHRNMVRSQNHVIASHGSALARAALTIRLSPAAGRADALHAGLEPLLASIPSRPGFTGAHLLQHQTPDIPQTTEQKIRGTADRNADWVIVVCGYEREVLESLRIGELSADALVQLGSTDEQASGIYSLSASALPSELSSRA